MLVRRRSPSHPRRNPPQTKPRRARPRRSRLPRRHRHRATAKSPQLRTAGGAVARQTLPINRPPRRSPRRSRARARRFRADTRNARDRPGAGAARGAGGDGWGQGRSNASAAADAVARFLRQRAHCRARLRGAGNDRGVRQSPRVDGTATRTRRGGWLQTTAYGSAATPEATCHRCGRTLRPSSTTPRRAPIRRGRRRSSRRRIDALVRRRVPRSAGASRTGSRLVPTRTRRRFGVPVRTRRRRRGDALPRPHVVAAGRHGTRGFPNLRR